MKFSNIFKVMMSILFLSWIAFAGNSITFPTEQQNILFKNLVPNPGFESGKNGWANVGGTFTTTTTAANVFSGKMAGVFTPSGAGQTLTSTAVPMTAAYSGLMGYARCSFLTSNSNATFGVNNGGGLYASSAIPFTSNGYLPVQVNFMMPSVGTLTLQVLSGSSTAAIDIDDCYFGTTAPIPQIWGTVSVPIATSSCTWTNTNTSLSNFATVAACGSAMTATRNASTSSLPAITFVNGLPPGTFQVFERSSQSNNSASGTCSYVIFDGTTTSGIDQSTTVAGAIQYADNVNGYFTYPKGKSGSVTFQIQSAVTNTGTCSIDASGSFTGFNMEVYFWPL